MEESIHSIIAVVMKRILVFSLFNLILFSSWSQSRGIELSHYIFPEFTKGTVLMKSGQQLQALMNYNTLSEEMIFEDKGMKLAISKEEKEKVDTVYIAERKFFVLDGCFVELLYRSGYELYAEHRCDVKYPGKPAGYGGTSETTSVSTYSGVYSGGILYELKLPDDFKINPYLIYLLKKDGEIKKFYNLKQLNKIFSDRKDRLKEYISSNKTDYNDMESVIRLIRYLEAN